MSEENKKWPSTIDCSSSWSYNWVFFDFHSRGHKLTDSQRSSSQPAWGDTASGPFSTSPAFVAPHCEYYWSCSSVDGWMDEWRVFKLIFIKWKEALVEDASFVLRHFAPSCSLPCEHVLMMRVLWCIFSANNANINFREKEKKVLDQILGAGKYDARIRPSGINGTGEC